MSRPPLVLVLSIGALASAGPGAVAPRTVTSPDGRIAIVFDVADGKPSYAVQYDGRPVIEPSALGIQLRGAPPLRDGLVIQDAAVEDVDLVWKPVFGTRSKIANRYRRLSVTLRESRAAGRFFRIDFRAYDDGVGFRYEIPRQPGLDRVEITGEETRIRFPENEKCFALLRKGFGDNYEGTYDPMGLSEIAPAALVGLPLLVEGDGHWVAVTEADLTDYAGLSLRRDGADPHALVAALAPLPHEEGLCVRGETPLVSPWRAFLVGKRAGDLIESNLVWNLNDPSVLADTSWIEPGKATWPWWNDRVVSAPGIESGQPSTAVMKYYTDFAARHHIPNLVVDAGWYSLEKDAWEQPEKEDVLTMEETRAAVYDIREVIRYARAKGVKVHLWVHLASLRNRVEEVLAAYAGWGASGIKLDNFGGDDQGTVNDLHHVIRVAAEHHLTVDFHGAYKPTGICRTYPNFLSSEAVMGLEFSKGGPRPSTRHNVTIPYTRMLAGPMDYTPGAFDLDGAEGFPKHVQGTRAQQMAMYVVYFSPFQMLVDYPAAYESAPDQFDFLLRVPTTWDETRFIEGSPGEYVVVARRKGDEWYLGAMTNDDPRALTLGLGFLTAGREYIAHLYRDGDDASRNPQSVVSEKKNLTAADTLAARLAGGGGFAVRLTPARQ
jgi:alpha-glucosidase